MTVNRNLIGKTAYPDFVDMEERAQAQMVLVANTAQGTAVLAEGLYDIWCTTDAFVKVGPGTVTDVTAANGYLLRSNVTVTILIRNNSKIGALSVPGGTFSYHMVN